MLSGSSAGLIKTFLEFDLDTMNSEQELKPGDTPLGKMLLALKPYDTIVLPDTMDGSVGEITQLLEQEKRVKLPQRLRGLRLRVQQRLGITWWKLLAKKKSIFNVRQWPRE